MHFQGKGLSGFPVETQAGADPEAEPRDPRVKWRSRPLEGQAGVRPGRGTRAGTGCQLGICRGAPSLVDSGQLLDFSGPMFSSL